MIRAIAIAFIDFAVLALFCSTVFIVAALIAGYRTGILV